MQLNERQVKKQLKDTLINNYNTITKYHKNLIKNEDTLILLGYTIESIINEIYLNKYNTFESDCWMDL